MWYSFPSRGITDKDLLKFADQITGKHLPQDFSQDQIREYMLASIHKMMLKFIFTKAGVWFGGRLSFDREAVVNNKKQLVKKLGQDVVLEAHLDDKACRCGTDESHIFTNALLYVVYEINNHLVDGGEEMPPLTPRLQEIVAQGVVSHTGDLVALHLILTALSQKFRKPIPTEWLASSPLSILAQPQKATQALEDVFDLLFLRNRALTLLFLDNYLSGEWLNAEMQRRDTLNQDWDSPALSSSREETASSVMDGYQRTAETMSGFIAQAERSGNIDALSSLLLLFAEMSQLSPGQTFYLYQKMSKVFGRSSEREAFLGAVGSFIGVGQKLVGVGERAISRPYVDKTEKDKVFLAHYHELFIDQGLADWIRSVYRDCMSIVG
jgi:hypothetical protein